MSVPYGEVNYRVKVEIERVPKECRKDVETVTVDMTHMFQIEHEMNDVDELLRAEMPELNDGSNNEQVDSNATTFNEKLQCYECKQTCLTKTALSLHLQEIHGVAKAVQPKALRTKSIKQECNHCDAIFKSKADLKRHWKTLRGEKASMCTTCFATFDKKSDLIDHRTKNEACGVGRSFCDQCGKHYMNDTALNYHIATVHLNLRSFSCHFCSKAFSSKGTLLLHEAAHENKRNFVCNELGCGATFNIGDKLKAHVRYSHEPPQYSCKFCGKHFKRPNTLREHIRQHTGEKPFRCDICDKTYTMRSGLFSHIHIHHKGSCFQCNLCKVVSWEARERFLFIPHLIYFLTRQRFTNPEQLKRHQEQRLYNVDGEFDCRPKLARENSEESKENTHIPVEVGNKELQSVTNEPNNVPVQISPPREEVSELRLDAAVVKFQCYVCKRKHMSIKALSQHLRKSHKVPKGNKIKTVTHHCDHCNSNFKSNAELLRHWDSLKEGKASICTVCFVTFDKKADLVVHRKTNKACRVGSHLCYYCGEVYSNEPKLKCHIASVHLNVKPFSCRFCEKSFSTKGTLTRHEANHENKRRFVCDENGCAAAFNNVDRLRQHVRLKHEPPKYVCKICGMHFKRSDTLR